MEQVIISLILFLVAQQVIFLFSIHKLVNKVMSGNYGNYVAAESQLKVKPKTNEFKVPLPAEEDLGTLEDFAPIP